MKKIIFLDVDGVLNSEDYATACQKVYGRKHAYGGFFEEDQVITHKEVLWAQEMVDNLRHIVEATGAEIVISSTWRIHFSVKKFKEMFTLYGWLDAPVIDKTIGSSTRLSQWGWDERGYEVKDWVTRHQPDYYVILDDIQQFLTEQELHFVNTSMFKGLTQEDALQAIDILNGIYEEQIEEGEETNPI